MTSPITPPLTQLTAKFLADPLDLTAYIDQDDFIGGINTAGSIGTWGWRTVGTSVLDVINAGQNFLTCEAGHPGIYHLSTTAVSGSSGGLILAGGDQRPICYDVGLKARILIRPNSAVNSALFVGFSNGHGIWANAPDSTRHWGLSYDTAAGDVSFQAFCVNAGANTKTSTGVGITAAWHTITLEITATGANVTIDGTTIALPNTNFPTASVGYLIIEYTTRAAAIITADVDVVRLAIPLVR